MGYMDKIWDDVFAGPLPSITTSKDMPSTAPSRKLTSGIQIPTSLDRSDSMNSPAPSPSPGGMQRRASNDYTDKQNSASQKISITGCDRRASVDFAHSLPSGFHFPVPDIRSPGSRLSEDSILRNVFQPASSKSGIDRQGSAKFEKTGPGSPSVYGWYNPIS